MEKVRNTGCPVMNLEKHGWSMVDYGFESF